MATGIASIAAEDHGFRVVSEILIIVAAVALPMLMFFTAKAWREFDMRDPNVVLALFTYVATYAMAVETGWRWFVTVSLAFLWIAFVAWLFVAVRTLTPKPPRESR